MTAALSWFEANSVDDRRKENWAKAGGCSPARVRRGPRSEPFAN